MLQALAKSWWLLLLSGVSYALISAIFFFIQGAFGPLTFHDWGATVVRSGELMVAACVISIAVGLFITSGTGWLLVLNGLALGGLGVVNSYLARRYRISILTVMLLVIVMAISMGLLEWIAGRALVHRHRAADGWIFSAAGIISIAFALPFLALGLQWIRLGPGSRLDALWLGLYFGFAAISTVALALRLHARGGSESSPIGPLPRLGHPRHAH